MKVSIILFAIFLPTALSLVFSAIRSQNIKTSKRMSADKFAVQLPNIVAYIGALDIIAAAIVIIGFTFFSEEIPHIIFYIVFGGMIWLGTFLILKTTMFKVVVNNDDITVYSICRKPYSFTFSDIIAVQRQVKERYTPAERIVVKTKSGRKVIVEHSEAGYKRFRDKILRHVDRSLITGFNEFYNNP